jgi:hypothetical protein
VVIMPVIRQANINNEFRNWKNEEALTNFNPKLLFHLSIHSQYFPPAKG